MKHFILVALVLELDGADALQLQPKPAFQNSPKRLRYEVSTAAECMSGDTHAYLEVVLTA